MTTFTVEIPDGEANDVLSYIKRKGGNVISENSSYSHLEDDEISVMTLAYAEESLKEGWDLSDEENDYWNSFEK